MIRIRRRSPRKAKILALGVAFGLGASTPTSSHALLTELVVGGTVLFQVAGIVGEALPQLAALTQSLTAVVKSGEEVGSTVGRIVNILLPGSKKKKKKDKAPAKAAGPRDAKPRRISVPTLRALAPAGGDPDPFGEVPTLGAADPVEPIADDAPAAEDATGEAATPAEGLDALFAAYLRQRGLEEQLAGAEGEQATMLQAGLEELSKQYELASEQLSEALRDAAARGETDAIAAVVELVRQAPEAVRPAVLPVIERLVGRGRRFGDLHGSGGGASPASKAAFQPLLELAQELS